MFSRSFPTTLPTKKPARLVRCRLLPHISFPEVFTPVNLRYEFKPIAVTYPTSTEQVAAVVSAGYGENYQVVARSGGVRYLRYQILGES